MKTLLATLQFIWRHPLNGKSKWGGIFRFVEWQIMSRIFSSPRRYQLTDRSVVLAERGMTGVTGSIYCGLHEFEDMSFVLHVLRKDDLFVDVGANVGVYSVLAAAHAGSKVVAMEPVPRTCQYLERNIRENKAEDHSVVLNAGCGEKEDSILFTSTLDTVNHVATKGDKDVIRVDVFPLDALLVQHGAPVVIKIDVEGFELAVLKGAHRTLSNPDTRAIIIEMNGSGNRYGFDDSDVDKCIRSYGFDAYRYEPFHRRLVKSRPSHDANTIFIRDLDFIQERIRLAPDIELRGFSY